MADIYMTASGDTWDMVALSVYGDEKYTEYLMSNNQDLSLLATVIFDAGTVLSTPSLSSAAKTTANQPPWRTS